MSFELRVDEHLRKSIRRIARKQIGRAIEALSAQHVGPRDEAVHEARKSFKRVRAILRLVRSEIGERSYRIEDRCFREAGRPLAEVRDAKILVDVVDKLAQHFREQLIGQTFGDVRKSLQDNLRIVRARLLDEQQDFAAIVGAVREARGRCRNWSDVRNKWSAMHEGLKSTYNRARKAYRAASTDPTVEKLHEWRKQVKYLRYQLEILRPLSPQRMDELIHEAESIGEFLGDDHDLAVLQEVLAHDSEKYGEATDVEAVLALAERRRTELQQQARLLGERFFQDGPKGFVRRVKAYWKAVKSSTLPRSDDAA